jgi:hypothetical protein
LVAGLIGGRDMEYKDYKDYAKVKGFQPLRVEAFEAMKRAGFFNK